MDDLKAIQLIQQYRHDVLNQLQLLSGYLSMKKPEKAEEKLKEWICSFEEERRLTSLHVPKFALWVIQFNENHKNMQLSYTIEPSGVNYENYDELFWTICESFVNKIQDVTSMYTLFEIGLNLREDAQNIYLELTVDANEEIQFTEKFDDFEIQNEKVQLIQKSLEQNFIAFQFVIANRKR